MKTSDILHSRGLVSPGFLDIRTGKVTPWDSRHNTISHDAAKAMAAAFGGDKSLVPNRIGIIYGTNDVTSFSTISRDQSWGNLENELRDAGADVQVRPFSYSPTVARVGRNPGESSESPDSSASSSPEEQETGWGVTFHSHSDSSTPGIWGSSSGAIFTSGKYIFQAVLLNKTLDKYTILARVSLARNSQHYTKPENFELALDWTIKFF